MPAEAPPPRRRPARPPVEPEASSGSSVTPEMMAYRGSDKQCESCLHFSGPDKCDRWPEPVEATGGCAGHEAGEPEPDEDDMPEAGPEMSDGDMDDEEFS